MLGKPLTVINHIFYWTLNLNWAWLASTFISRVSSMLFFFAGLAVSSRKKFSKWKNLIREPSRGWKFKLDFTFLAPIWLWFELILNYCASSDSDGKVGISDKWEKWQRNWEIRRYFSHSIAITYPYLFEKENGSGLFE